MIFSSFLFWRELAKYFFMVLLVVGMPVIIYFMYQAKAAGMQGPNMAKVKKAFSTIGTIWWYGSLALFLLVALDAHSNPQSYLLIKGNYTPAPVTYTPMLLPNGSVSYVSSIQSAYDTYISKINNTATLQNVFDWVTGAFGAWFIMSFVILFVRIKWLQWRLEVYEPKPKQPGIMELILNAQKKLQEQSKAEEEAKP